MGPRGIFSWYGGIGTPNFQNPVQIVGEHGHPFLLILSNGEPTFVCLEANCIVEVLFKSSWTALLRIEGTSAKFGSVLDQVVNAPVPNQKRASPTSSQDFSHSFPLSGCKCLLEARETTLFQQVFGNPHFISKLRMVFVKLFLLVLRRVHAPDHHVVAVSQTSNLRWEDVLELNRKDQALQGSDVQQLDAVSQMAVAITQPLVPIPKSFPCLGNPVVDL